MGRVRQLAFLLWLPALLACFVGPLAEGRDAGDTLVLVLLASVLGGLMGSWQGRKA